MREIFDCAANSPDAAAVVRQESAAFTDYLNFFELVSFLAETKQLSERDVLRLFDYYLKCLKRHPQVVDYIQSKDKGFEQLSRFLARLSPEPRA